MTRTTHRLIEERVLTALLRTKFLAKVAAFAMSRESIQRIAFRTVSQIGIHYRESSLSESLNSPNANAPRAGDRFPWLHLRLQPNGPTEDLFQKLDDIQFNLIIIGQPLSREGMLNLGDKFRIHVIPDDPVNNEELERAHISKLSFYLLRPDGYVGLCGSRLEGAVVNNYALARLGLRLSQSGKKR